MRKLVATIFTFVFVSFSANAIELPGLTVGVSGSTAAYAAKGQEDKYNESGGSVVTTTEYGAFATDYPSVFIELGNDIAALGIDYVVSDIDTPTNENDSGGVSGGTTPTSKVKATIDSYMTAYLLLRVPVGPLTGLYVKGGISTMDITSNEVQLSGNTYGNASSEGTMLGIGYEVDTGTGGLGIRAEVSLADFDDVSVDNGVTNKNVIKISDMWGARGTISIVKSF